jgi:hypothetical protein
MRRSGMTIIEPAYITPSDRLHARPTAAASGGVISK